MIHTTFISLKNHLKNQVPELANVLLFNNQYKEGREGSLISPSVLIEFKNVNFIDLSEGYQQAGVSIGLHICISQLNDFENSNADGVFNLVDKVHKAVQGFVITHNDFVVSSKLTRKSMQQVSDFESTQIWLIGYECMLYDRPKEMTTAKFSSYKIN